jgi:hypothetical protein
MDDFVKSLSDEQLDDLFQVIEDDGSELCDAVHAEYFGRERRTSLTFYTPHVDEFKQLLRAETTTPPRFAAHVAQHLTELRLAPGWSPELEAAFKILMIELAVQICI